MPKRSVDSKLEEGRDQTAEIMAKDLTKNLVDLRDRSLRPNAGSKLGLNHVERSLHVRPLVVVLEEFFAVIGEEFKHTTPQFPTLGRGATIPGLAPIGSSGIMVGLEGDEREGSCGVDSLKVGVANITTISGDRLDSEPLSGCIEEGR